MRNQKSRIDLKDMPTVINNVVKYKGKGYNLQAFFRRTMHDLNL